MRERGIPQRNSDTELRFANQTEMHDWLARFHLDHQGVWLRFDKMKKTSSLTAEQALDEALCFGWIDGVMQSLDEQFYVKYFARRTKHSIWSDKNKKAALRLIEEGRMLESGLAAIKAAQVDGRWYEKHDKPSDYTPERIIELIAVDELALKNFMAMSESVRRTYAFSYFALKKPESRAKRLIEILKRLRENRKPFP